MRGDSNGARQNTVAITAAHDDLSDIQRNARSPDCGRYFSRADLAPLGQARFRSAHQARMAPFNQVDSLGRNCRSCRLRPAGGIAGLDNAAEQHPFAFQDSEFEPVSLVDALAETDQFAICLSGAKKVGPFWFILGSAPLSPLGSGHDAAPQKRTRKYSDANEPAPGREIQRVSEHHSRRLSILVCLLQKPAYDAKLHALAKVDYSRDFFLQAAAEIKAILRAVRGESRKLRDL